MHENSLVFDRVLDRARSALLVLQRALSNLNGCLDQTFVTAVQVLSSVDGHVVFTGVGKSAAVANKLAHTFASLGIPAFFVHATELGHGDLGNITSKDVVVAVSYSGETVEVVSMLRAIKTRASRLISLVGLAHSTMADQSDISIEIGHVNEVCHLALAPTTSTSMTMVVGDLLAVCAAELRAFTQEDFARSHPSGRLGQVLTLQLSDVMLKRARCACVDAHSTVLNSVLAMAEHALSIAVVFQSDVAVGLQDMTLVNQAKMLDNTLTSLRNSQYNMPFSCRLQHDMLINHAMQLIETTSERYFPVFDQDEFVGLFDADAWRG
ncbi:MAG: D-arabinose 5-phosphate isomerase [Legionellales bacterium]|nr:D-arabinose 5-phosphate isomerase [Legionellales bacterium]|tara:strand:+ start:3489 stop:4457 length:969 start_codon:yes stop_codon:yes gene_type:complete